MVPPEGDATSTVEDGPVNPSPEAPVSPKAGEANPAAPSSPPASSGTVEVPTTQSAVSMGVEPTEPQPALASQTTESTMRNPPSGQPQGTPPSASAADTHSTQSTPQDHSPQNHLPQLQGADATKPSQSSSSPQFNVKSFREDNLEAIAAAQITAGLGDFHFSSSSAGDSNDLGPATSERKTDPKENGKTAGDAGDKPPPPSNELLDEFIAPSDGPQKPGEGSSTAPTSSSSSQPIPSIGSRAGPSNSGASAAAPPLNFQRAFSTFNNNGQSANVGNAFNTGAPAAAPAAPSNHTSAAVAHPSNQPSSAPKIIGLPSTANGTAPLPSSATTSGPSPSQPHPPDATRPQSGSSSPSVRPPQANANGIAARPPMGSTMLRPMPPLSGGRPPPPRPGPPGALYSNGSGLNGRPPHPPSMGGRPPAPALPASALFSQGPPGMPSFAALLGSLGPQDLAMVAHAAMGLDANGDPLPGNEESHRALADAMRKLRESAAVRPPPHMFRPPPYHQQHYQTGMPLSRPPPGQSIALPRPRPKMMKPRPIKLPKQPSQDAWILARAASEGGSLDGLCKTGDPLQDKLPLIAGPRPERAPPRGGPPPEKRFQCSKCDRAFARAYNLNTHFATHDPDPNRAKPFPCPYPSCKSELRSFSRKHDLQRHIASTHEAEPEPIIEIADVETGETIQSNLAKLGLGAPGRKFRCECGRAFVRRDALRKHSCEAMRGRSLAELEASSHSPSMDPRSGYGRRDEADALARRAAGLSAISGSSSGMDGPVDFEALAASFAADAAQEMQAAQDHAARRAGDGDNEDEEEGDDDDDDAIANFASQLTAGAAAELGLTATSGQGDRPHGQAGTAQGLAEGGKSKGAEAAGGGEGEALEEDQLDDAAAQYIAQLQTQLGGADGSSKMPGLEGLMSSVSGASTNGQEQENESEDPPQPEQPVAEGEQSQQYKEEEVEEGVEQQSHQQQQKRPAHDGVITPAHDAGVPSAPKRVKREDEEYDQLGDEVEEEAIGTSSVRIPADTSIPA